MSIIVDTTTAAAVVRYVKRGAKVVYPAYVEANGVTIENVAEHVAALRELAYPGIKASGRAERGTPERMAKNFADSVRLGLRTALDDRPTDRKVSGKYLTAEALKDESLEQVIEKARAEWLAANE